MTATVGCEDENLLIETCFQIDRLGHVFPRKCVWQITKQRSVSKSRGWTGVKVGQSTLRAKAISLYAACFSHRDRRQPQ